MQSVTSRRVPTSRCGAKVKLHVTSHHVTTSAIPCMTRLQAVTARRHVMSGRDAVLWKVIYRPSRHVTSGRQAAVKPSRDVTGAAVDKEAVTSRSRRRQAPPDKEAVASRHEVRRPQSGPWILWSLSDLSQAPSCGVEALHTVFDLFISESWWFSGEEPPALSREVPVDLCCR